MKLLDKTLDAGIHAVAGLIVIYSVYAFIFVVSNPIVLK